jgi:hypothetical protein
MKYGGTELTALGQTDGTIEALFDAWHRHLTDQGIDLDELYR